jgi:hypothetical protein
MADEEIEMRPLTPQEASGREWKTLGSLGREGQFEMDRISMSVTEWEGIQAELISLRGIREAAESVVMTAGNGGDVFDAALDGLSELVKKEESEEE